MTLRSVAAVGLLALAAAAVAAAPATQERAPSQAPEGADTAQRAVPTIPKFKRMYGSIPDTGQFLPDSAVLARVNDRIIRVGEFIERYYNSYAEYRPSHDSTGRVLFLNNMVKKEILADMARKANRPESFEDRVIMRQHTVRVLSNVLFQRAVLDSVQ